jgi:hypothetical protein
MYTMLLQILDSGIVRQGIPRRQNWDTGPVERCVALHDITHHKKECEVRCGGFNETAPYPQILYHSESKVQKDRKSKEDESKPSENSKSAKRSNRQTLNKGHGRM